MHNFKAYLKEIHEAEKKYLVDGKRSIASGNIVTLSKMSFAATVLALLSIILSLILVPGYKPAVAHIVAVPLMAAFTVATALYRYKGRAVPRVVTIFALVFEITAFLFVLLVDIYSGMDRVCFMPIVITAFASGTFFSSKTTNILNLSYTAIFIFCDMMHKVDMDASLWKYDVFIAILGFAFATFVGERCRTLRIQEYNVKMNYKYLSQRDPLLENIFNKRGYEDAIDNYLITNNPNIRCAFIVLDLNNFKHINDNYGHDMGDQILRCMSDTLVSLFRDSDIIGRFGGDEFIVLADGLCDEDAVEKKCRYIAELIGRKAQETGAIKVFSSLGAVICDNQKVDFERLFEEADKAMYEAKEMGRDADRFILRHYSESDD